MEVCINIKYTAIKPSQNRITAKYECESNPALTAYSSVNVTDIRASPSTLDLQTIETRIDKITGSKGNPSRSTILTSQADE